MWHSNGPPPGFAGPNDRWHQHNANGGLCIKGGVVVAGEESTRQECANMGGHKTLLIDVGVLGEPAIVQCEQLLTVGVGRLDERITNLPPAVMQQVDAALALSLGLPAGPSVVIRAGDREVGRFSGALDTAKVLAAIDAAK